MKITVITDSNGQVTGTIKGHAQDFYSGDILCGPVISEEMQLHEIEVPDEFEKYYQDPNPQQAGLAGQEERIVNKAFTAQEPIDLDELHKKVSEYIKNK
jgi:hypothetical protein